MYSIIDNDIVLTRGDSLYCDVEIYRDDEPYEPVETDKIRFAVKKRFKDPDDQVLIVKNIPYNNLILHLDPEDTKPLKMNKTYVYDVQLTNEFGDIDTFIKGTLTLTEEVI